MSSVAVLSDAHLQGPDDPAQDALIAWLDALALDELVLLGDLFHYWWGYPGSVWPPFQPVVQALGRCRARGIPVTLVPGNHDFAVGPVIEELGIRVRAPHLRKWGGKRYLLLHGDEADWTTGYRLTRRLLRGPAFAGLMTRLGEERGYRLLQRLAGTPGLVVEAYEPALFEAQRAYAEDMLGSLADVVVLGHVHRPRLLEAHSGTIIQVGGWLCGRTWLRIDDGEPSLVQGLGGLVRASLGAPVSMNPGPRPDSLESSTSSHENATIASRLP
jgi:UDP-2,3-diacylglucosamine hydrolase